MARDVGMFRPALPKPSNGTSGRAPGLPPILNDQKQFAQDCGGCGELHNGIAQFIRQNPGTDEEVAEACGVSLAVVRQAKVRHTLLLRGTQNG